MPSLNVLQAENIAHGADITIVAQGVSGLPGFVTLGEIYEMDWDEDNNMQKVPVLGSRLTGMRRGRFTVTGTIKSYWINTAVESMLAGMANVTNSGSASIVYHSARSFVRYNILCQGFSTIPNHTLINVTFDKDAMKISEAALVDQTINFSAEDILGN